MIIWLYYRQIITQYKKNLEQNCMKYTTTGIGVSAAGGTIYFLSKEQNINHLSQYLTKFGILNLFIIFSYYTVNSVKLLVFGNLSNSEIKFLKEKIYYTTYEFIIGLLMIKFLGHNNLSMVDDTIPLIQRDFIRYLGLFTCVFLLKCFHHLSIIRINTLIKLNLIDKVTKFRLSLGILTMNFIDIKLILLFKDEFLHCQKVNPLLYIFGFEIMSLYPSILIPLIMLMLNYMKIPNVVQIHCFKSLEILNDLFRFLAFLIFNSIFIKFFTIPTIHLLPNIYSCLKLLILNTRNLIKVRKNSLFLNKVLANSKVLDTYKDEICSICRDDINLVDNHSITLKCNHSFHWDCLKDWLVSSKTCPYCRKVYS